VGTLSNSNITNRAARRRSKQNQLEKQKKNRSGDSEDEETIHNYEIEYNLVPKAKKEMELNSDVI
jgi:hypothetical protein